jgi:SP family myo-inositol transporter-like MFS transporter 13
MLQAAQQLCGINTVMYYSATILKLAGFTSTTQAIWLSAGVSFCNFFGSCIGLTYVESSGRRRLTLLSIIAVSFFLGLISLSFYLAEVNTLEINAPSSVYKSFDTPDICSSQKYCLDCVQVEGCGFCSTIPREYDTSTQSWSYYSGCIKADGENPSNSSQCLDYSEDWRNFSTNTCEGGNVFGWLIFASICLYLLAFAPGMGPMPWCINSEVGCTTMSSSLIQVIGRQ